MTHFADTLEAVDLPPGTPAAVTVGTFDGVHRAHRMLLREAAEMARGLGGVAIAVTFRNHPRAVVAPDRCPPLLTAWPTKRSLIAAEGIDHVVGLEFSPEFSRIEAEDFVRRILVERLRAKAILSGPNFHFGRSAAGGPALLRRMSAALGFAYRCDEPLEIGGEKVSSSRIRALLAEGDVAGAAELLDRPHANEGIVVPGDRIGRTIGFPTANLALDPAVVVPGDGVYAVDADVDGRTHRGMMNIGWRPTVGGRDHRKEVHLLDFEGDLTGRRLRVAYRARLRGEQRFPSLEALKAQLAEDRRAAALLP